MSTGHRSRQLTAKKQQTQRSPTVNNRTIKNQTIVYTTESNTQGYKRENEHLDS